MQTFCYSVNCNKPGRPPMYARLPNSCTSVLLETTSVLLMSSIFTVHLPLSRNAGNITTPQILVDLITCDPDATLLSITVIVGHKNRMFLTFLSLVSHDGLKSVLFNVVTKQATAGHMWAGARIIFGRFEIFLFLHFHTSRIHSIGIF